MIIKWILLLPVSWFANFVAILLSPILALPCFVTIINGREWLIPQLSWFQTIDNPVDEGLVGGYFKTKNHYLARLYWLIRNPAYGFGQTVLGANPPAWQFKNPISIGFGYYLDINIGWKSHAGFTRLMYASRLLTFPKKY